MNITLMKAKNVTVGIKNGMTGEDFCNKYQCSLDEFQERVKQLYGHNKKQLKNCFIQIAANEKKARKEAVSNEMTEVEKTEKATKADEITESVSTAEGVDEAQATTTASRVIELTYLAELEDQQSKHVMALESEHKELANEHRALRASLRELSENIDKLMSEFKSYHQKFEEILSRNAVVETRMNEITTEWGAERTALDDTRARIEELSIVVLSVFASGDIAPMDGAEIELDDSDWESTRDVLLTMDDCQELRLKDITTLARLLKIVEHADCKIDVICDNSELESVFQKLRGCG